MVRPKSISRLPKANLALDFSNAVAAFTPIGPTRANCSSSRDKVTASWPFEKLSGHNRSVAAAEISVRRQGLKRNVRSKGEVCS
jgi:hypothetical protein